METAMPGLYSTDLRSRALEACDAGERPGVVAKRFRIGRFGVYLWLKQRRGAGRDRPKEMGGGPQRRIRDAVEAALKRLGASDNHLRLAQDRDTLADETGLSVHPWPGALALAADAQKRRPTEQDKAAIALPEGDRTSGQARKDGRTELEAIDRPLIQGTPLIRSGRSGQVYDDASET